MGEINEAVRDARDRLRRYEEIWGGMGRYGGDMGEINEAVRDAGERLWGWG